MSNRRIILTIVLGAMLVLGVVLSANAVLFGRHGGGAVPPLTANQTITNSCAGSLCTPVAASCAVFTNGLLTGFSTGAC